jgi:2-hydroxychromene-2-carboxylate isomerase
MAKRIEFFFDLSSPWTRIAFHNIQKIAAETGSQIHLAAVSRRRRVQCGEPGRLRCTRERTPSQEQAHLRHGSRSGPIWLGLRMNFPSPHHPVKSVHAMRFCCALEDHQDALLRFSEAAFEAYFGDQRSLDDPAVLKAIADQAGFDGEALAAQSVLEAHQGQAARQYARGDRSRCFRVSHNFCRPGIPVFWKRSIAAGAATHLSVRITRRK